MLVKIIDNNKINQWNYDDENYETERIVPKYRKKKYCILNVLYILHRPVIEFRNFPYNF